MVFPMNRCAKYEGMLARFVHGELLLAEKDELERHLAMCSSCEAAYRDVVEMDLLLRNAPEKLVEPAPYLRTRILANLPEAAPAAFGIRWGRWAAAFGGVAVAVLALVLVVREPAKEARMAALPQRPAGPAAAPPRAESLPAPAAKEAGKVAEAPRAVAKAAPRVPVQVIREVKIYFYYPPAQKVAVTGDFNGWDKDGVPLTPAGKPGLWTAKLRLKPGAYSYNFIVDGETLVPDPDAPTQSPDGYGGTNSILLVKEGKRA